MAEQEKRQPSQKDAEFDGTYLPENLSDTELIKAYVALMRLSVITRSHALDRVTAEMKRRGIELPH